MGAPIYLVSACASGEEFVAAFRRYADRTGLFIPIGEPLPPGRRSRFAVTLRDGGVMIEGEAEIVSSARAPSVMHGRVGMTLRFVEPDEASRTTLIELEKARLAMKPAPPSVPPRPAAIPAEPRPVPPPAQGRIDAVNALAECVAIGDVSVLGPPLPPASATPPKAGLRSVLPGIPPSRGPGTSPPGALGAAVTRRASAPIPVPIPRADAEPPPVSPRATPQPDRRRSAQRPAVAEVTPGPTSDTMVAVAPPLPATIPAEPRFPPEPPPLPEATGPFEKGPLSATMTAVPVPTANPPSAPTEIGGPIVAPIHGDEDISARTEIHAGAPRPPGIEPRIEPRPYLMAVTMHGVALEPRAPAPPQPAEIEIAEPTDISMPPEPPLSRSAEQSVASSPSTEPENRRRVASADAPDHAPEAADEAAADEPDALPPDEPYDPLREPSTDPSSPRALRGVPSGELPIAAPVLGDVDPVSGATTHPRSVEADPDAAPRPRRTVIGVAVQPGGVLIPPAPPRREPMVAGPDEPTGILIGDPTVDAAAPTIRPGAELQSAAEPPPSAPMPATPAPITGALPSGDWTIALDPAAPGGWSPPRQAVPRVPPGGAVPVASAPDAEHAAAARMPALAASPPDARTLRPGEVLAVEPKVQIDPTLVEPHSGPLPTAATSPGLSDVASELAMYGGEPGREPGEAPALHAMMAVPQPGPYAPAHASPAARGGPVPGYPVDPPYAIAPGGLPPGLVTADGSGFGPVRYPPVPSQLRRRHLVIMLASALIAVLLGIAAMLLFRRPPSPIAPGDDRSGAAPPAGPGEPPRGPAAAPPTEPAAPPAAAATPPPPTGSAAAGAAAPAAPAPGDCYADVSSVPAGADIVLDQARVIGMTPQRVALPCGHPVELLVRKPHLVPAVHTLTPSPDGAAIQFVLVQQTFLVKVSSTPSGATVTLGGKPLGVTPTMVKVPAFEPSTLSIARDGYDTETETVAPKGNGTAVHSVLKRIDRRKR